MKTTSKNKLPKLTINIKTVKDYIPKTDRYNENLKIPIINKFNISKKSEKNKTINTKSNHLKSIAKNYSITVRKSFYSKINKKKLINKSHKELINSRNKISSSLSNSKKHKDKKHKNENIQKRFSLTLNKNKIKSKMIIQHKNTTIVNNKRKRNIPNNNNSLNKSSKTIDYSSSQILRKRKLSIKSVSKKEKEKNKNNPFEIEEEDKIFKRIISKKKKKKKQKKLRLFNSRDAPLNRVYKKIPYIMTQLNQIKKLKNDMPLIKYQKTLLDVGSQVLDRDMNNKLNQKFFEIRKVTEKKYDYFEFFINSIEDKEKKIIKKINTQQNFFKRIMVNHNKSKFIYGTSNKVDFFPEIKFYPTPKHLFNNSQ